LNTTVPTNILGFKCRGSKCFHHNGFFGHDGGPIFFSEASAAQSFGVGRFTGESVPVKFFTTTFETQMPKTTFYMPVKVTLTALSEVRSSAAKSCGRVYTNPFWVFICL